MKYKFDDLYEGPRFQNRARKRKIKLIIAGIVAIIGLFIIIGIASFFSSGTEEANGTHEDTTGTKETVDNKDTGTLDPKKDDELSTDQDSATSSENSGDNSNQATSDDGYYPRTDSDNSSSYSGSENETPVAGTIENNGGSAGTQTQGQGDHVTDFTKGSEDWQEMTQAVSSATGLGNDNMIVWWMGNGGGPNKAVSRVSSKDKQTSFEVQLEWVNGAGWKASKVVQTSGSNQQQAPAATNDLNQ